MSISITYFPPGEFATGTRYTVEWPALVKRLAQRREVRRKEDAPGFSFASFTPNRRLLANVERVHAVGLDLDKGVPDWKTLVANFQSVACFIHTTWRSQPDAIRARAFLRLSRPVTADEYYRVWRFCEGVVKRGGLTVDGQAKDPSRFWYLPACAPKAEFLWAEGCGNPIDVDGALEAVPKEPELPPALQALDLTRNRNLGGSMHERQRIVARAEKYLAACAPAISGQGGHNTTFLVAQRLVRGFALDENAAFALLSAWNQRCSPPWSEHALRRKIRQALDRGTMAIGQLL
ncbi:MAG: hypothetical protein RL139_111 [Gemmatimonadota bacterium]|jgi:hypothetical protein